MTTFTAQILYSTIELFVYSNIELFVPQKNYRIIFFKEKKIILVNKFKSITSAQCTSYAFKVSNFCWIQILENFCESFDLFFFFPFFLLKLVILDVTEKEINISMRC